MEKTKRNGNCTASHLIARLQAQLRGKSLDVNFNDFDEKSALE
jgi:hypothetical protein